MLIESSGRVRASGQGKKRLPRPWLPLEKYETLAESVEKLKRVIL